MATKGKTHKASVKRFKKTGTGKLIHKKQMDNSHLKAHKNQRTRNRQNKSSMLDSKRQNKKINALISA
jgi:large subunit ribosomal protein L35